MELQLRGGDEQFSLPYRRPVRRKSGGEVVSPALRVWSMRIAFGMGAAGGAVMTEVMRARSHAVPVALLVLALLLCAELNARRAVAVVVHVGDLI
jgi:hypothetical protein